MITDTQRRRFEAGSGASQLIPYMIDRLERTNGDGPILITPAAEEDTIGEVLRLVERNGGRSHVAVMLTDPDGERRLAAFFVSAWADDSEGQK